MRRGEPPSYVGTQGRRDTELDLRTLGDSTDVARREGRRVLGRRLQEGVDRGRDDLVPLRVSHTVFGRRRAVVGRFGRAAECRGGRREKKTWEPSSHGNLLGRATQPRSPVAPRVPVDEATRSCAISRARAATEACAEPRGRRGRFVRGASPGDPLVREEPRVPRRRIPPPASREPSSMWTPPFMEWEVPPSDSFGISRMHSFLKCEVEARVGLSIACRRAVI